jgi:phospholipid N-methyltransferase
MDNTKTHTGWVHFLWAGLARRGQTGGLIPSQRFLISKMIEPVPSGYDGQILELGSGTGALTLRLAAKCPAARILACEINPRLAQVTRANMDLAGLSDRVKVLSTPAETLLEAMAEDPARRADYIFSGIPLGALKREQVLRLVRAVAATLRGGGWYIQFQHSLIDRKRIRDCFRRLRTVPVLWNLPPAFVYYAQK